MVMNLSVYKYYLIFEAVKIMAIFKLTKLFNWKLESKNKFLSKFPDLR